MVGVGMTTPARPTNESKPCPQGTSSILTKSPTFTNHLYTVELIKRIPPPVPGVFKILDPIPGVTFMFVYFHD
tara:strand:- start:1207 stop:1425 length:219 start_codon:yes stop_codon:yes gene_type:complete